MVSSSVGVHAADRLAPTLLGLSKARWRTVLTVLLAAFFVLVPLYAWLTGDSYVLILMGRILVFALAAVGLNLALGYGGMVSFGHAMYLGIGAYVVAIASHHGLDNGLVHLLLVAALTVAVAIPVGLIALRTQGIAFIMITLAFAQMLFFVAVGLKQYGGDEGLSIVHLSRFGALTGNKTALYLSMLLALGLALWLLRRVVASLRPGGSLLIRETDPARRGGAGLTRFVERAAVRLGWNLGPKVTYRPISELSSLLSSLGLAVDVVELAATTHPGNVLLTGRRPNEATRPQMEPGVAS